MKDMTWLSVDMHFAFHIRSGKGTIQTSLGPLGESSPEPTLELCLSRCTDTDILEMIGNYQNVERLRLETERPWHYIYHPERNLLHQLPSLLALEVTIASYRYVTERESEPVLKAPLPSQMGKTQLRHLLFRGVPLNMDLLAEVAAANGLEKLDLDRCLNIKQGDIERIKNSLNIEVFWSEEITTSEQRERWGQYNIEGRPVHSFHTLPPLWVPKMCSLEA
ncbi:hypothetical protein M422DRAFT_52554 [Sphaerobolus stellatus SS14]|uniref:Uncharacterized protein n=1 Tax=Sphaerobolus stellatus (strain SS14) TaxID=990650 RepID=A0A0C9V6H4_SPHS4|nr:hypothetical protein M422DRAFT_52554 [Sphaerobolus stellatus SS14]